MVKYIIKRILQAIVVVFLITCITFSDELGSRRTVLK